MVGDDSEAEKLKALGFATTGKISDVNLSGSVSRYIGNTKTLAFTNIRVFSRDDKPLWMWATDQVEGRTTTSWGLPYEMSLFPVYNSEEDLPIYGIFSMRKAEPLNEQGTTFDNWLGKIHGLGVFQKADGSFVQGCFQGVAAGSYDYSSFRGSAGGDFTPVTFLSQLSFDMSYLSSDSPSGFIKDGRLKGLLGPTGPFSLWKATREMPVDATMLGVYEGSTLMYGRSHIFRTEVYPTNFVTTDPAKRHTTIDGGSYYGYLAGAHASTTGSHGFSNLEAMMYAIYIDPQGHAGILKGSFGQDWGGDGMLDIDNANFSARGILYTGHMGESGGIAPENIGSHLTGNSWSGSGGSGHFGPESSPTGNIYLYPSWMDVNSMQLTGSSWGIWSGRAAGTFDGMAQDNWSATFTFNDMYSKIHEQDIAGTKWSDGKIAGTVTGYGADITGAPNTWISIGEIVGTFNYGFNNWQMINSGLAIDTNKFLQMAADEAGRTALQRLNVPCVEVGLANLNGLYGDMAGMSGNAVSVQMNNVKFFAPTTGGEPKLWATGSVSGGYFGNPANLPVNLSGGGLQAQFQIGQWDQAGSKWIADVRNGQGTITATSNGNPVYPNPIQFKGAAAGAISSAPIPAQMTPSYQPGTPGSFAGTAAGLAKKQ
jgi:hypothetical protein